MKMIRTLLTLAFAATAFSLTAQDISFNIEMTSPKRTEPLTIKVASSGQKMVVQPMAAEMGSMRIIIDHAAKTQHLLMDNNGKKMAMQVDPFDQTAAASKVKEPVVKVTNETKTIDGMKCTKVIAETDEATTTLWVTEDAGLSYQDLFKIVNANRASQGSRSALPALSSVKGFPLEVVTKEKSRNEAVVMNIRNISRAKVDASMFSMDGYQVSDMRKIK
jgi:hypothetical protein